MKIAIFGGSFDPPHIGHEAIVNEALISLDIDKLYVVPTYLNPFKDSFFLDELTRLELVKKLFINEKRVTVSSFEVEQKRAVATIDTVEYLKKLTLSNKIYLIIGEDNLDKLHLWNKYELLKELVTFCIATRGLQKVYKDDFVKLKVDVDITSTNIRENLDILKIPKKIRCDIEKIFKKV